MTYVLRNRIGSGGFVVEAALALAGQRCRLISIDSKPNSELPASFGATNAWRQVPVLELPDGTVMTETAAILIYIAAAHPGPQVGPKPGSSEHASFLRWTVFLSVNIYEGTLRRIYPHRFTSDPAGHEAVREAASERNHAAFRVVEGVLAKQTWLSGEAMSLADVYLAMLYAWHRERPDLPHCTELTDRIAADEIVAPIWQRNFDHRLERKWGRDPMPSCSPPASTIR